MSALTNPLTLPSLQGSWWGARAPNIAECSVQARDVSVGLVQVYKRMGLPQES